MRRIRFHVKNTWNFVLIPFYFFTSHLLSVIIFKALCNFRQILLANVWKLFLNGSRSLSYKFLYVIIQNMV
jgi:hypothetical protein